MAENGGLAPTEARYSSLLRILTGVGALSLAVTFALIAAGAPEPSVPLGRLGEIWSQPVSQGQSWGALMRFPASDALGTAALMFMAAINPVMFVCLSVWSVRRKQPVLAAIAVLQLLLWIAAVLG